MANLLVLLAPSVFAQQLEPPDPQAGGAASNLAVSLDPSGAEEAATDGSAKAGLVENRTATADPAVGRRPAPRLPRRPDYVAAGRTVDGDTPWHRTGLGALAIVLALIGAGYALLRKYAPGARTPGTDAVRVVGRTPLSPKHSLALVRVGRRFVLIGVAGDRVTPLSEVTDPHEVAELAALSGDTLQASATRFDATLLKEALGFDGEPREYGGHDPADEPGAARDPRTPSRYSVTDLLGRLRRLQSSEAT
jgi:flagellar biogenesis protein FliO